MLQDYIDYFKGKTEAEQRLNGFYLGDMDDVFNNKMKSDPEAPLLFLEVYSVDGTEWNRDHAADTYLGAFVVYDRVPDHELCEASMAASLSFSEATAKSIIASMKEDRDAYHPLMRNLKGNFQMNKTRRMFDGLVGWRVEFEFISSR